MATNVPGIFAAGNVTAIYDLVDYVSKAGQRAGSSAARYAQEHEKAPRPGRTITIQPGPGVGNVIPQTILLDGNTDQELILCMRPNTLVDQMVKVHLDGDGQEVMSFREQYARPAEMIIRPLKARDIEKLKKASSSTLTAAIS